MIRMNAAQQGGVAYRILPRAGRAIAACSLFGAMAFGVSDAYGGDARTSFDGDEGGRSVFAGALRQASPALFEMLDERSSFLEEAAAARPSAEELRASLALSEDYRGSFSHGPKPAGVSEIHCFARYRRISGRGVRHLLVGCEWKRCRGAFHREQRRLYRPVRFLWMKLPTMRALGIRAITRRSAWRMKAETTRLARRLSAIGHPTTV